MNKIMRTFTEYAILFYTLAIALLLCEMSLNGIETYHNGHLSFVAAAMIGDVILLALLKFTNPKK